MKRRRGWSFAGLVCLALLGVAYLAWGPNASESPLDSEARPAESSDRASQGLADEFGTGAAESAAPSAAPEPLPAAVATSMDVALSAWAQRYPEGQVAETRRLSLGSGRYRRQQLIETGVPRLPWVVWEDTLQVDESGAFYVVGYRAYLADAFLARSSREGVEQAALQAFLEERDVYVKREPVYSEYYSFGLRDRPQLGEVEALVADFQARFPGALAELDGLHFTSALPNDWDAARMWGLDRIHAPDAWEFATGAEAGGEVVVAVIDTGLNLSHPDIRDNVLSNPNGEVWDFIDGDSNPQDTDGHGTHVAGIAGATGDNGFGSVGVNWSVKILPLKAGTSNSLPSSAILDALAFVTQKKDEGMNIVVTNNSYGGMLSSQAVQDEIGEHRDRGIVFVAAAGNDGVDMDVEGNPKSFPAAYPHSNIISVASSHQDDGLNFSSNRGATSVDIAAPGSDVYSTHLNNGHRFLSGTSMASPMVAGAVALLAKVEPQLTAEQLKARILDTAERIPSHDGRTLTGGRLDLLAALRPELSGHRVEVSNVRDPLAILDSAAVEPVFEVAALPGAELRAEVIEGAEAGQVEPLGGGRFVFRPAGEGVARLRFTAALGGIERSIEKSVVVGRAQEVSDGLLHHYGFDGDSASEPDLAGSADGTLEGAQRADTEFGRSGSFSGGTSKMSFSGQFSQRVTIAALVKSENLASSPHPRIVNTPSYYLYFSTGQGPGVPDGNRRTLKFFANYDTIGVWNGLPDSIAEDRWYYVVGSFDSAQPSVAPSLYLNGAPQTARLQSEPSGSMVAPSGNSFVGNNDLNDRAFEGKIADVRVYDRILDPAEVASLGATLLEEKWQGFTVVGPETVAAGAVTDYAVESSSGADSAFDVEWAIQGEGGFSVEPSDGAALAVAFASEGDYRVVAQVSDGVATRFFSKQVAVEASFRMTGFYQGETGGGGMVWLEVDSSLDSGVVTLFDVESGFYRFREAVAIDSAGAFETSEQSAGRIAGNVLEDLVGEVAGYGVSFTGEFRSPLSDAGSAHAGDYLGGALGVAGDRLQLRVSEDGRVQLWREGPLADLGLGAIDPEGAFELLSVGGVAVNGLVDLDADAVTGEIGGAPFFLKRDGMAAQAQLRGGAIVGFPSGAGSSGVYGAFVRKGERANGSLAEALFALPEAVPEAGASLLALQANARAVRLRPFEEASAAQTFAKALEAGALDLDQAALEAIRAQVPLRPGLGGAAGFSIRGTEPLEILIRGLGPSFAATGAPDPAIRLYRLAGGEAEELAANENWRDGAVFTLADEASQGAFRALQEGFEALELSPLEDAAKDAALRVWLAPGDYLAVAEAATGESGSGLLEVFALTQPGSASVD